MENTIFIYKYIPEAATAGTYKTQPFSPVSTAFVLNLHNIQSNYLTLASCA